MSVLLSLLQGAYRLGGQALLFQFSAETAHGIVGHGLQLLHRSPSLARMLLQDRVDPVLSSECCGLRFSSPLLLAAGFDKAGAYYNALGALGFSAVEVGTVTAHAQDGNPQPRLFRLPDDHALLNRMGFNNPGCEAVAAALRRTPAEGVVLGVNIGKSKITALEDAASDYATSARCLGPLADYLVVNVSSPNTPGLRSLQTIEALRPILTAVQEELAKVYPKKPLFVKIAPELSDEDVDAVAELALELSLAGVLATNTTISRTGLRTPEALVRELGAGGISGPPVFSRAISVVKRLYRKAEKRFVVVGVGGISSADDAWEMLCAGASLVQVYTGFVYGGPAFAQSINRGIAGRLRAEGHASVASIIGSRAGA